ncbi:hypothetical protein [Kitasatospora sp. NBC_01302]|nr:hypothetical protein OG294_00585 [Kitasatospora sp. NBC_01302]
MNVMTGRRWNPDDGGGAGPLAITGWSALCVVVLLLARTFAW